MMLFKFFLAASVLLAHVSLTAAFTCLNGCSISDGLLSDGWCDCSICEDEADFTCETCGSCPSACGERVHCSGAEDLVLLSFMIAANADEFAMDDNCVGAIVDSGSEYVAPGNLTECPSLNEAFVQCFEYTTDSDALRRTAADWDLDVDWNETIVSKCEFLFVHWEENDTFAINEETTLEIELAEFAAAIYPWQHSWNNALRSALNDAGALEKTRAIVDTNDNTMLFVSDVLVDATITLKALELTSSVNQSNAIVNATNSPQTNVFFTDVLVRDVNAVAHAPFGFVDVGNVGILGTVFSENTCPVRGCVDVADSVISVTNSKFVSNSVDYGFIYMYKSSASVENCTFKENTGSYGAGAFYADDESLLSVVDSRFVRNKGHYGGAIDVSGSYVAVAGCKFDANRADYGGAIYSYMSNSVSVVDCTFSNNVANYGGAMRDKYSPLTVTDSVFEGNEANYGGALDSYNGEVIIDQCTFAGNTADDYGGVLYAANSPVTATDSLFTANVANFGAGALYIGDELSAVNCTFDSNIGAVKGGAIIATMGTLSLKNSSFLSNSAVMDGGAIVANNTNIEMSGCLMDGNSVVWEEGGAIYSHSHGGLTAENNKFIRNTARIGGAIVCADYCTLTNNEFVANEAYTHGGGVAINGGSIDVDNCKFVSNFASEGGGVYVGWYSTATLLNSVLERNTASRGACVQLVLANVFFSKYNVYRNNTAQLGGASGFEMYNILLLKDDVYEDNTALDGGHIHSDSDSLFWASDNIFSRGKSTYGGGLYLSSVNGSIVDCDFHNNTAIRSGGAIVTRFARSLRLTRLEFEQNNASDGGALAIGHSSNAWIEIDECNFIENLAQKSGGAIATNGNENCEFYVKEADILANVVEVGVGAIALDENKYNYIALTNCRIEENEALNAYTAGIFADASKTDLILDNCTFEDNLAVDAMDASAIYMVAIGDLEASNCKLKSDQRVLIRAAKSIEMVDNQFGEDTSVTMLNAEKDSFGSVLFENNAMHSSVILRSFPVYLGLNILENEATNVDEICPKCELYLDLNATDVFGSDYTPMSWCDLRGVCYELQLEWAQEIEELLSDFSTDDTFYQGKGDSSIWLTPLQLGATVNLSLQCAESTANVDYVCGFNAALMRSLLVTDCASGMRAKELDEFGYFECKNKGKNSASSSLSGGVIAAIVICTIIGGGLAGVIAAVCIRKYVFVKEETVRRSMAQPSIASAIEKAKALECAEDSASKSSSAVEAQLIEGDADTTTTTAEAKAEEKDVELITVTTSALEDVFAGEDLKVLEPEKSPEEVGLVTAAAVEEATTEEFPVDETEVDDAVDDPELEEAAAIEVANSSSDE